MRLHPLVSLLHVCAMYYQHIYVSTIHVNISYTLIGVGEMHG